MTIGKRFRYMTFKEYLHVIENHKRYTDFNTLGLYRSILENEKITETEKVQIREYAHRLFRKSFDFLQLKDPYTFVKVSTLDQIITVADEAQVWKDVIANQQRILEEKKIKHRNFGTYAKHMCAYDDCPYNGLMVRQDSRLAYGHMHFDADKNRYNAKEKSLRTKKERKNKKQIVDGTLEN